MIWDEDENFEPKAKRSVGRPVENPFPSPEVEAEFVSRGQAMIDLYYHPAGPNTRHDFVFSPRHAMSKTLFWSLVFIHYVNRRQMKRNLQGFLATIHQHFGTQVVSDRTSLAKSVKSLDRFNVHQMRMNELDGYDGRRQKSLRSQYQYVMNRWEAQSDTRQTPIITNN